METVVAQLPVLDVEDSVGRLSRWLAKHVAEQTKLIARSGGFQFSIRSVIQDELHAIALTIVPKESGPFLRRLDEVTNAAPFVEAAWRLTRSILTPAAYRKVLLGD